ncbi:MAG: NAD(P)/FAD-dependent oxidoreductase [Actinomycetia bacterium]|nr:NAD(P)/FAD-dependent oxidoreductase [Actinomycetes bacterium]
MTTHQVDIAVIGGGAAGLAAVREARRRGASALIVNRGPLGGDCTFTGCIPSKSVIEAARVGASFAEAFQRARQVVEQIAATETPDVLRAEGIVVLDEEGVLVGPGQIRAGTSSVKARGVVLALGGRPVLPPISGLAESGVLTTDTIWELHEAPSSLTIIGGGAIGCELGQALATLGVSVTLVELAPRLLPGEEVQASAIIEQELRSSGVNVYTGVSVEQVEVSPEGQRLQLSDGSSLVTERVLVAAGRKPSSDRGALSETGVELDRRGYIKVGDDLATNLRHTYAAGDITGKLQLTHAADAMGRIAATNILRRVGRARFRAEQIPRVTFTSPEVASIGLSEGEAARMLRGARVAELPLAEHDRAVAADMTNGYLKLISGPKGVLGHLGGGRLVGATIVAERAGEMMAELALALRLRVFIGRLAMTTHPYPTWSYAIPKVAAQFFTTIESREARPAKE